MELEVVVSKCFSEVGYDPKSESLYVRYVSGDVYRYCHVPGTIYAEFRQAASLGSYLTSKIKPFYPCEKVPDFVTEGKI